MSRNEPFRPRFHYTSARNWINDPNGLVWFEGEYHLFYQYNPEGNGWGHMSWGHAVSTDLVNWTELPVAIPEDERAMAFSGSVVVDLHNTSGLGQAGQPVLVACFTACLQPPAQRQVQDLAFSTDRGRTWKRHAGNPVLDIGLKDFRDPKVFWHAPSAQWVMVVVVPDAREARFYGSPNLLQWTELSRFSAPLAGQGIWECPDLIELPVEGGGTVWMFKVDVFGGHPSGETGARLFFGDFDGQRFVPQGEGDAPQWADYGSDFYAALSWSHLPQQPWQGRGVWLAWMSCHRYAAHLPTEPWRGAMTLPRMLHARRHHDRWKLVQTPVEALESLRMAPHRMEASVLRHGQAPSVLWSEVHPQPAAAGTCAEVQWSIAEITPAADAPPALAGLAPARAQEQRSIRLTPTMEAASAPQVVMRLVTADRADALAQDPDVQVVKIGYDALAGVLFIDRARSGFIPQDDERYAGRRWAPCRRPTADHPLTVRVWWDWSSVEVIADDGTVSLTEQIYPRGAHQRLELQALNADVAIGPTTVWPLKAARMG